MKVYFQLIVAAVLCVPMLGCKPAGNSAPAAATKTSSSESSSTDTPPSDASPAESGVAQDSQIEKKDEIANMAKKESNAPAGKEPDVITVQHCLIGFSGSVPGKPITRTKEEAKELAERLLKRLEDGDKFGEIINQFTDDSPPGIYKMTNNGVRQVQGAYPRGGMVPAFGDTGFPLQVGEYGLAPFDEAKSPYGWHIVKRIE